MPTVPVEFTAKCDAVEQALDNYYQQLVQTQPTSPATEENEAGNSKELLFVANFRKRLEKIKRDHREGDILLGGHGLISSLKEDLETLQTSAAELPLFTQQRMIAFAAQARREYPVSYTHLTLPTIYSV